MRIKEKLEGNVAVLTLSGKMMGGPETTEFHNHIKGLIADQIHNVVVDLSKVKWMNSSGLGVLMASMTSLRNSGGDLRLANAAEKVHSLLVVTQLLTIFKTFDTKERAVASYSNE